MFLSVKPTLVVILSDGPSYSDVGEFLKTFLESNLRLCITKSFKNNEISQSDPMVSKYSSVIHRVNALMSEYMNSQPDYCSDPSHCNKNSPNH